MPTLLPAILLSLFAAARVSAHGYVSKVVIDGVVYLGNEPAAENPGFSPIRQISTIDPVKIGTDDADLFCGQSSQLANITASAKPGSSVTFQWSGAPGGGDNWPHNVGPLMTYMTSCGSSSCNDFANTEAEWFKIDELGMNGSSTWYQGYLRDSYTIALPQNIAPGGYLIRHEIIALQLGVSLGGAEFYPSCTQVVISGSETGTPDSDETCMFPGCYSATDPGILVPDIYNPGFTYDFPGPNLSNLANGGYGMITAELAGGDTTPSGTTVPTSSTSVAVVASPTTAGGSNSDGSSSGSASSAGSGTSDAAAASTPTVGTGSAAASSAPKCQLRSSVSAAPYSSVSRRHLARAVRRLFARSSFA